MWVIKGRTKCKHDFPKCAMICFRPTGSYALRHSSQANRGRRTSARSAAHAHTHTSARICRHICINKQTLRCTQKVIGLVHACARARYTIMTQHSSQSAWLYSIIVTSTLCPLLILSSPRAPRGPLPCPVPFPPPVLP